MTARPAVRVPTMLYGSCCKEDVPWNTEKHNVEINYHWKRYMTSDEFAC